MSQVRQVQEDAHYTFLGVLEVEASGVSLLLSVISHSVFWLKQRYPCCYESYGSLRVTINSNWEWFQYCGGKSWLHIFLKMLATIVDQVSLEEEYELLPVLLYGFLWLIPYLKPFLILGIRLVAVHDVF